MHITLSLSVSLLPFLAQNPITTTAGNRLKLLFFFFFRIKFAIAGAANHIVYSEFCFICFIFWYIWVPLPSKKKEIRKKNETKYENLIELTWGPFELGQGEFYYYGQCVLLGKRIFVCLSESRSQVRRVISPSLCLSLVTNWFAWAELIFQVKDRAKKLGMGKGTGQLPLLKNKEGKQAGKQRTTEAPD